MLLLKNYDFIPSLLGVFFQVANSILRACLLIINDKISLFFVIRFNFQQDQSIFKIYILSLEVRKWLTKNYKIDWFWDLFETSSIFLKPSSCYRQFHWIRVQRVSFFHLHSIRFKNLVLSVIQLSNSLSARPLFPSCPVSLDLHLSFSKFWRPQNNFETSLQTAAWHFLLFEGKVDK